MSLAIPQIPSSPGSLWTGSAIVVALLAMPVVLTSLAIRLVISVIIWRQISKGLPVALPHRATMIEMAFGFYSVINWIAVFAAWRWSARRGFAREVFAFRRLTWVDAAIAAGGFFAAFYGAPLVTHWAGSLIGGGVPNRSLNMHHAPLMALSVFSLLVTAPIAEEVLFRGLLIAWLRRLGWPIWIIWLVGSLAFASIHLRLYGPVWTTTMVFFGAMILAIRLWRNSLTPGWLIHLLFNARYSVIVPLAMLLSCSLGG